MSASVLLTVSGRMPDGHDENVRAGLQPRADYRALAARWRADLMDYDSARGVLGSTAAAVERVGGPNAVLAVACDRLRDGYDVVVTDGEQVGIPLAGLWRTFARRARPWHFMIAHRISAPKKAFLVDALRLQGYIDQYWTYSSFQKRFIEQRWAVSPERVKLTPFMVDSSFFRPGAVIPRPDPARPQICAVGLERRDYRTLLDAVDGVDADVIVAAASPWSKQKNTSRGERLPRNVRFVSFDYRRLRQLYADSAFLVMPLKPVDFQAGVTAILEAFAMERPIVCSRTPGQTDVVRDGHNGVYVPPRDAAALRRAIEMLLADPARTTRMGRHGRATVDEGMSLDHYVERLTGYIEELQPLGGEGRALPQPDIHGQVS